MTLRALVAALMLQGLAWGELPPLDGPPAYAQNGMVGQLQSLPSLGPGEHVFALLELSHFSGEPQQFVVEIRNSKSYITIYSKGLGTPVTQHVLNPEEVSGFLGEIETQKADALPDLTDQGVFDLPEIAYYHWTGERGHVLLLHGDLSENPAYRIQPWRQDTAPYRRLIRTIWKSAGVWVGRY